MNERQRAIEDVAREFKWSVETMEAALRSGLIHTKYAVTQRERVLILEAENAELKAKLEGQWNAKS